MRSPSGLTPSGHYDDAGKPEGHSEAERAARHPAPGAAEMECREGVRRGRPAARLKVCRDIGLRDKFTFSDLGHREGGRQVYI